MVTATTTTTVKDLREATAIWELALLDLGVTGLTYDNENVYFEGMHVSARRSTGALIEGLDEGEYVTIPGRTLSSTLSILSNDDTRELKLKYSPKTSRVHLVGKDFKAQIQTSEGTSWERSKLPKGAKRIKVARAKFIDALEFGQQVVAKEMSMPVLSGVHCSMNGNGRLVLKATNGSTYAGIVWAPAEGDECEFITPPTDLLIAARLLSGDVLTIGFDGKRVHLSDDTTDVVLTTLATGGRSGDFPDLGRLPRNQPHKITLKRELVGLMQRAAAVYDTDRLIRFHIEKGVLRASVKGQERGAFIIEERVKVPDGDITFDGILLGAAVHLGRKVTMHYGNENEIVLMSGDAGRYFWLAPVLVSGRLEK